MLPDHSHARRARCACWDQDQALAQAGPYGAHPAFAMLRIQLTSSASPPPRFIAPTRKKASCCRPCCVPLSLQVTSHFINAWGILIMHIITTGWVMATLLVEEFGGRRPPASRTCALAGASQHTHPHTRSRARVTRLTYLSACSCSHAHAQRAAMRACGRRGRHAHTCLRAHGRSQPGSALVHMVLPEAVRIELPATRPTPCGSQIGALQPTVWSPTG